MLKYDTNNQIAAYNKLIFSSLKMTFNYARKYIDKIALIKLK